MDIGVSGASVAATTAAGSITGLVTPLLVTTGKLLSQPWLLELHCKRRTAANVLAAFAIEVRALAGGIVAVDRSDAIPSRVPDPLELLGTPPLAARTLVVEDGGNGVAAADQHSSAAPPVPLPCPQCNRLFIRRATALPQLAITTTLYLGSI